MNAKVGWLQTASELEIETLTVGANLEFLLCLIGIGHVLWSNLLFLLVHKSVPGAKLQKKKKGKSVPALSASVVSSTEREETHCIEQAALSVSITILLKSIFTEYKCADDI